MRRSSRPVDPSTRTVDTHSDATTEWMAADVAARCAEVIEALRRPTTTTPHAAETAEVLRRAADDLGALARLIDRRRDPVPAQRNAQPFELAFGTLPVSLPVAAGAASRGRSQSLSAG